MSKCVGFLAVADAEARVLILGSLPGAESLRQGQYYAKKQNGFWQIMGALIAAGVDVPYRQRLEILKKHRIALWDVCAAAERVGSLDSAIEFATIKPNDFKAFFKKHKHIERIYFNGQPAGKLFTRLVADKVPEITPLSCKVLPSTSPAHARMNFEEKLAWWREALRDFL